MSSVGGVAGGEMDDFGAMGRNFEQEAKRSEFEKQKLEFEVQNL